MEDKKICCYDFGDFRLDARRRSLSKNGEKVPLSARNFDLLLFMVENDGRILEHDELLEKVWAGTFVEQATLKKGISALRQILVATPENEFIKTIPRRGYSFVTPVKIVPENNEVFYVRETEQEIIVEEFIETDEPESEFVPTEKTIEIPVSSANFLPAAETKERNFRRLGIYALTGIAALFVAFFGIKSFFPKTNRQQFSAENVRITRITNSGKVVSGTTVSPDGNYVVYPTMEKDGTVLWVRQTTANSQTKLTVPLDGNFWGFAVAPDDSYVYYIFNNTAEPQKSGLFKIPLFGGEPQRIAENVSSITISPDGKQLALVRIKEETELFTTDANGENPHIITTIPTDSRLWSINWTPDGMSLLCAIRHTVNDKMLFRVVEIAPENGMETLVLPEQERNIFGASWLPDKSALLVIAREANADIRQIWQYFPASKEWRRITNDNNSYKLVNLTRDGKVIVSSQESRLAAIWLSENVSLDKTAVKKMPLINRDNFHQITDGISSFDKIGWLAGNRLVYSATEDGKELIFTMNADGANARSITVGDDGIWIFPSVAGNKQSIAFLSMRAGIRQVWSVDPDGKNLAKLTDSAAPVSSGLILRDNATVIYQAQSKSGGLGLFKRTPDGQTAQLTDSASGDFAVSPDEKLLALETVNAETRQLSVELRSLEDGKTIKVFDFTPFRQMSFTPDGKNIAFDVKRGDVSQIFLQPLEGGEPQALTDFQSDEIFGFDWSPDGARLAVIRGKQLTDVVVVKAVEQL